MSQNIPFFGISSYTTMESLDLVDVTCLLQLRRQSRMQSDELTIDHTAQRKIIEDLTELLEHFLVVLNQHFLSECETRGHLPALVVASQENYC